MNKPERISSYQFADARTNAGQVVSVSVKSGKRETVKQLFERYIVSVNIPPTHKVNNEHGCFGRYSRYDMSQHKYAGGHGGYIEVLEIKDPPDERWPIVIYFYSTSGGSYFLEWKSLESAKRAFDRFFNSFSELKKHRSCKRVVHCGSLTPWFYAVGDQDLIGDYAFPERVQDDSYYRFGEQYVVYDKGVPSVKTCLGTRFVAKHWPATNWYGRRDARVETFRLVYFTDGYVWDERESDQRPRPIAEEETWIAEAMQQFRECLAGVRDGINIKFTDGTSFTGSFKDSRITAHTAAGDYLVRASFKDEEPRQSWIENFVPTTEDPDIVTYVMRRLQKPPEAIKVVERKVDGKRTWSGVFLHPPSLQED